MSVRLRQADCILSDADCVIDDVVSRLMFCIFGWLHAIFPMICAACMAQAAAAMHRMSGQFDTQETPVLFARYGYAPSPSVCGREIPDAAEYQMRLHWFQS